MYRFFMTRSGRCYAAQDAQIYHYDGQQQKWVKVERTLADLEAEPRVIRLESEDDLPPHPRWVFRRQFSMDSRRIRKG